MKNIYSDNKMHLKRPKIVHNIKLLHVSAPGHHLKEIRSTKVCSYRHNSLANLCTLNSLKFDTLAPKRVGILYVMYDIFGHAVA